MSKSLIQTVLAASQGASRPGFVRNLTQHCACFFPRSDQLIVSFDNVCAIKSKGPRLPWGHGLAQAMGWSHLGVMTKRNDWFRHRDVHRLFWDLDREDFFQGFTDVVFYGASMGGYAACAFSAAVPGARVVAFSPQSTLRADLVPFETRYHSGRKLGKWKSGPWMDATEAVAAASDVKLFYDPHFKGDALHIARFHGPQIKRFPAPFMGHKVPRELRDMAVLSTVATAAIDNTLSPLKFYQLLRKRRDLRAQTKRVLRRAMRQGHDRLVERVLMNGNLRITEQDHATLMRDLARIRRKTG